LIAKGEETIAVFESNEILQGDSAAEGQNFKDYGPCLGETAMQGNCEYNPFHYEWYPFNANNQRFSFGFPDGFR
jgi:hypothetical protein